jgi:DNA-binding XRE family transcriptional regulator
MKSIKNLRFNLKDLRIRKDLTQLELAEELKVSHQTISNRENGQVPPLKELIKIAEFFKVSIDDLLM